MQRVERRVLRWRRPRSGAALATSFYHDRVGLYQGASIGQVAFLTSCALSVTLIIVVRKRLRTTMESLMPVVSITDIARVAGVAPSTVSRALQNHPRISPARCLEIQALARDMGYRPSQAARSLVTGRTQTLGVVVTDVTDPFVAEVLKGAEAASRETGYGLLFAMSNRDPGQEITSAQMLLDRQVDGMVVISSRAAGRYPDVIHDAERLPVVLVNNDPPGAHIYSVRMNNVAGVVEAITYLSRLGHRRIAFVAGPPEGRSSRERLEGYYQGLAANRLPVDEELVIPGTGQLEDGASALQQLLSVPERPSAVLCYNDLAAIGVMSAATIAGISVPGDLSVVGFDNIPLSGFTVPPLTSVDQPKQLMGRRAVDMCSRFLRGESVTDEILAGHLVVRGSAGPPKRGS
jgi:LacI family transcriptional regulator, repressor for deo operon, udp, cdd, tsx, nupC, and nupG